MTKNVTIHCAIGVVLLVFTSLISATPSYGQVMVNGQVLIQNAQGLQAGGAINGEKDSSEGEGASDKDDTKRSPDSGFARNADLETILLRAQEFVDSQQYVLAGPLLQKVIEDASGTLTHVGEHLYLPTRYAAIRALKDMPPEGIKAYRLPVDPKAASLWKRYTETGDFTVLEQVVRQYLMSSVGDQAAFELASFYLDSHEYSKARRLLEDIVKYHPDPDVDGNALRMRLFVAYRKAGNEGQAKLLWESLSGLDAELKSVLAGLRPAVSIDVVADTSEWRMPFGNIHRTGVFSDVVLSPQEDNRMVITAHWDLPVSTPNSNNTLIRHFGGAQRNNLKVPRAMLAENWRNHNRFPANQIYRHGDRIYVASYPEAYVFDLGKASPVWTTKVPFPSKKQNAYYTSSIYNRNAVSNSDRWYFLDTIGREISFNDNIMFRVEKHLTGPPLGTTQNVRQGRTYKQVAAPSGNQLVAYDVNTGKPLWRIGQAVEDAPPPEPKSPAVYVPPLDSITVDGDLKEWASVKPVSFAPKKQHDGLRAELRVAWTVDGLAASFKVVDDVSKESTKANALWEADGIEFFAADEVGSANMFQLLFAPGRDKAHGKLREQVGSHHSALRAKGGPKYTVASKVLPDGYTLECFMPWTNLTKKAEAGAEFAFQAYVNDVDEDLRGRKVYSWHPKTGTHANTSRMMPIILDGPNVKRNAPKKPVKPVLGKQPWNTNGVRFLGAPTPLGKFIIVPVLQAHGVTLVSLEAATGELLWERLITSYYGAADTEAIPAAVTEHDGTVYVCVGFGVVAALDVHTGHIEWVASYHGADNIRRQSNFIGKIADKIVVLPNDASSVIVLDAANGRRVREMPDVDAMAYVLGIDEDQIYLAGNHRVLVLDHGSGDTVWESALTASLGKGVLTTSQVLIPDDRTIRVFGRKSGKSHPAIPVSTHLEGPIGNLHVTPEGLLVSDLRSLYCIRPEKEILAQLEKRIGDGETDALIERARIYAYGNRISDAVEDYLQVVKRNIPSDRHESLRVELYNILMRDVENADAKSLAYLDKLAKTPTEKSAVLYQKGKAAIKTKQHQAAFEHFAKLISMDSSLVVPVSQKKRQHVSLAALTQINSLSKAYPESGYDKRLNDIAQGAMSAMGPDLNPKQWGGLYRKFSGTSTAFRCGINAAAKWIEDGNVAMADLMLDEMGLNADFSEEQRAQAHMMRALLMAKMDWLHDAHHFVTKINTLSLDPTALNLSVIPTTLLAFKEAVLEAKPVLPESEAFDVAQARLKWSTSGANASVMLRRSRHGNQYQREFLSKHTLLQAHGRQTKWICKRMEDGKDAWTRTFKADANNRYYSSNTSNPQLLVLYARHARNQGYKLIDMLTGKDLLHVSTKGHAMSGIPTMRRGIMVMRHANDKMGSTVKAHDILSGLELWQLDIKQTHGHLNQYDLLTGEPIEKEGSNSNAVRHGGWARDAEGNHVQHAGESEKYRLEMSYQTGVKLISKANKETLITLKGHRLLSQVKHNKVVAGGPKGEITVLDMAEGKATKCGNFGENNQGLQARIIDNDKVLVVRYLHNKTNSLRVFDAQGKILQDVEELPKFSRLDHQLPVQWPYAFFVNRNSADLRAKGKKKIYNRIEAIDLTTGKVDEALTLPKMSDLTESQKKMPRVGHMYRQGSVLFMSLSNGMLAYELSPASANQAAEGKTKQ